MTGFAAISVVVGLLAVAEGQWVGWWWTAASATLFLASILWDRR